ncbi:restriction endonuclease subunit S [Nocardiopsis dassonvillei]|uniref:restriction endonuclease subunit S n=1 Tax=Nocardiopsis dassonvillei TaxID=2014 RepID=UPI00200D5718|nr:restriction endonuclease subunit S [Nocardiopsis dassonvillei]MCK9873173.1 restriction endonuclease subunit S [Nocardiopsis dassonvillei]
MDSLTGPLPAGWREQPLGEVCEVRAGPSGAGTPTRGFTDDGVPLVRPRDIAARRVDGTGAARVAHAVATRLDRYRLEPGDVLGTRTGTLGRFAVVAPEQRGWLYSTQLVRMRPSPEIDPVYLVHYLDLHPVRRWIDKHASGSTVRSVTQRTLRLLPTVLPPLSEQQAIGTALDALDDKARLHAEISRTTDDLRETLAPMLFSGRVPVPGEDAPPPTP